MAGQHGVLGPAIAHGSRASAMQMHHRPGRKPCDDRIGRPPAAARLILRVIRCGDSDDRIRLIRRNGVDPFDLDDGTGQRAFIRPHLAGRQVRVQLDLRGTHLDSQVGTLIVHPLWMHSRRDTQSILEFDEGLFWLGHAVTPPCYSYSRLVEHSLDQLSRRRYTWKSRVYRHHGRHLGQAQNLSQ